MNIPSRAKKSFALFERVAHTVIRWKPSQPRPVPLQIASQKQGLLLANENLLRARGPDMTELRRTRLILNAIVRQVQVNVKQMTELYGTFHVTAVEVLDRDENGLRKA